MIYGIGHAVYTISDPRAVLLKELARDLAHEKGREREFAFLELLEERAIATFGKIKNNGKTVSSNVDFIELKGGLLTEEELTPEQKVYFEYTCRGGDYIKTCTVPSPHLNGDDLEREKKMLKL